MVTYLLCCEKSLVLGQWLHLIHMRKSMRAARCALLVKYRPQRLFPSETPFRQLLAGPQSGTLKLHGVEHGLHRSVVRPQQGQCGLGFDKKLLTELVVFEIC